MSQGIPSGFPGDEQNPYAPPLSDVGPEKALGGLTPMPFSIGDVVSRSWEIYKDRLGLCLGVFWGAAAINFGAQIGLQIVQTAVALAAGEKGGALVALIAVVGGLGLMVFQIWIGIGQALLMLGIARGQVVAFGDVFSGGRYILGVFLASLIVGVVVLGAVMLGALVGAIPGGLFWLALGRNSQAGPAALVAFLCLGSIILAIVAGLRISQFYYLIIDRNAGALESISTSFQITRGRAGLIFVIGLIVTAVNIAGLLACFVGLIFTVPYGVLTFAVTYLALTGQPTADPYGRNQPLADLEPL
jgi:uncharacterized membrane protein